MRLFKTAVLAVLSAIVMFAQQAPVAAKADGSGPAVHKVAPTIGTAKLWRLVSKTQAIRQQLDASELGKSLKDAEAELQAEQNRLIGVCGPDFTLGLQQDAKAENSGDVVCVAKPPAAPEVKK